MKEKQSNGEVKEPISKTDDQQKKPLTCPRCGQENDSLSVECSKCGIVFLKYYEIQARGETDEEKKAELLEKKEEEEKKAEALRKQKEEERTEALRKQKEEEERTEALRKQKEEEERTEALRKQKEEEERTEALRKQKEEEKAEALRKQKEEEERTEALRKQKEEEKAEALRKQKEEEERTEALRNQKEEEKAEAFRNQKEDEERELQKRIEDITNVLKPKPKIKDLLKKYEGQTIGINYDSPTEIKGANLVKVGDDLFSILILDDELMKSYPLKNIMSIIEGVNGVSAGDMEEKSPFSIIIQVYHPVF